LWGEVGFDLSGHDEEIGEIGSNLKEDAKFRLDLEQADWLGFEIPSERGLFGRNGTRVEVRAVDEAAVRA
jgi:hypothetical protein